MNFLNQVWRWIVTNKTRASRRSHAGLCAALLCATLVGTTTQANPDIIREGAGDRRAALDAMELTPFDQGLWSGLADWRLGEPVDADSTRGKVVVIYTFSGYLPTAVRPISIAKRLADRYGDDGLVMVGVHADEAYDEGVAIAEKRRVSFPIARDAGGALRRALKVDQDPDFYVIDRAGRLRFADVETASIERAVSSLLAESADDARTLLDRRAASASKAAEDARRSAKLRSQIDLNSLPWVPFALPSPEAYSSADWPKMETDNSRRRSRNAPTGPVKIDLAIDQDWRPGPPRNTEGRATLIYLFTDKVLEDFNKFGLTPVQLFAQMDRMHKEHARDLIVIGAMIPSGEENSRRRRGSDDEDARKRAEKAEEVFDTLDKELPVDHARINDYAGGFIRGRITPNNGEIPGQRSSSRNGNAFIYPYHIIVSSDGIIRWHGSVTTSAERNAEWEAAFAKVLANDPGIRARHEAEQAYIKSLTE